MSIPLSVWYTHSLMKSNTMHKIRGSTSFGILNMSEDSHGHNSLWTAITGISLSGISVESNLTGKANGENKCRDFHEVILAYSEESN